MQVGPILAAMRRNPVGALLIALQMALTLAVLSNAVFIISERWRLTQRTAGVDEANIFTMTNAWSGDPVSVPERLKTDLAALRSVPGVVDAYAGNSYPFLNSGNTTSVDLHPDQRQPTALAAAYFVDEHGLRTLGLRLIAGRNFSSTETTDFGSTEANVAIVTQALASKLFPRGEALGHAVYLANPVPVTIVGVVDRLQVPFTSASGWGSTFSENSILVPVRPTSAYAQYIVRTQPGRLPLVMEAARQQLLKISRSRILSGVHSLPDARREAYRDDRGFVIILVVVCVLMLAVTACGIVGLTSYWVMQRRRQIGVRRALGGTRGAIVGYFQTENLLIALVATVVGVALAVSANLWAVSTFEMARLPNRYALIGAGVVILLGQAAALWPALRAALVPPALAARST
jgi:putative ABC transport system permease protein